MNSVLVIAAHPDDEILGCGATIALHALAGDTVHVVIMAEGVTSRDDSRDPRARSNELKTLATAAHEANQIVGTKTLTFHGLPDNRLDSIDLLDMVKVIEGHIETIRPNIVYTHHAGDLNIDHQRIHAAVATACRPLPDQSITTLLFFEIPSSTEWQPVGSGPVFQPNWFVDVSSLMEKKLDALRAYGTELRSWPHPRSLQAVETLAGWRGASVGVSAAEAFMLGRRIS